MACLVLALFSYPRICPGIFFSLVSLKSVAERAHFLDSVWSPFLEIMVNLKYKN